MASASRVRQNSMLLNALLSGSSPGEASGDSTATHEEDHVSATATHTVAAPHIADFSHSNPPTLLALSPVVQSAFGQLVGDTRIKELEDINFAQRNIISQHEKALHAQQKELEALTDQLDQCQKQLAQWESDYNELRTSAEGIQRERDEDRELRTELETQLQQLQQSKAALETSIDHLTKEKATLNQRIKEQAQQAATSASTWQQRITALTATHQQELQKLHEEANRANNRCEQVNQELETAQKAHQEALKTLQQQLTTAQQDLTNLQQAQHTAPPLAAPAPLATPSQQRPEDANTIPNLRRQLAEGAAPQPVEPTLRAKVLGRIGWTYLALAVIALIGVAICSALHIDLSTIGRFVAEHKEYQALGGTSLALPIAFWAGWGISKKCSNHRTA